MMMGPLALMRGGEVENSPLAVEGEGGPYGVATGSMDAKVTGRNARGLAILV
jgi:hypothetical protein